jgi:hypothetical protein
MCTLTFVPREDGYYLAMNRDESIGRGVADPPARTDLPGLKRSAIYPRDVAGGTWIAANDTGIALALLNWNVIQQPGCNKTRSRGIVIPHLARFGLHHDVEKAVGSFDLMGLLPFRLVGIFPLEKKISEWRWKQDGVQVQHFAWERRHWFSSGLSDEQACTLRGGVCQSAWDAKDAGSLRWLRQLHASHANGPGAFSLCVHREGVQTLSYTELVCAPEEIECRYFAAGPCAMLEPEGLVTIQRVREVSSLQV